MTTVIETDEAGYLTLPDELLQVFRPHTKYVIDSSAEGLSIYPERCVINEMPAKLPPEEWLKQGRELAEEIGKVWPENTTAAKIISEMRR